MSKNTLFDIEEMQDNTATAIRESDTRIQYMSKLFAKIMLIVNHTTIFVQSLINN